MTNETRKKLNTLRKEYQGPCELDPQSTARDPFVQFRLWFEAAIAAQIDEANAMALATVAADGKPSARMVLLKDFDNEGFYFFSNYQSRKGRELAHNPHAALLLYWQTLERQVRIEGAISRTTAEVSDHYFQSRPRGAQLSAAASHQSEAITDRVGLEEQVAKLEAQFDSCPVTRPAHWGGYQLRPERFEFWQGRENRLHDRVQYVRTGAEWYISRLAP